VIGGALYAYAYAMFPPYGWVNSVTWQLHPPPSGCPWGKMWAHVHKAQDSNSMVEVCNHATEKVPEG